MDQVDYLRRLAEAERLAGRASTSLALAACADMVEARAAANPEVQGLLIEAARKRKGGPRRARGVEDVYMPGALPAAVRRAVTKEVASLFDSHGEELFKGALEDFRKSFEGRFGGVTEKLKTALKDKYGSEGLARHLPYFGEWRTGVLANLMELGAAELMKMERYSPGTAPNGVPQVPTPPAGIGIITPVGPPAGGPNPTGLPGATPTGQGG